jgi:hypothetical protein
MMNNTSTITLACGEGQVSALGCTICGKPAGHDEAEYELEFTRKDDDRDLGNHHVHLQCFAAWELKRTNFEPVRATVASSDRSVSEIRPSPGAEARVTTLSGTLPAPSNHRMIAVHERDGTEERGSG